MPTLEEMRLDTAHIEECARYAAGALADEGHARVKVTPGDMTEYHFVIVAPGEVLAYGEVRQARDYMVALCASFGAAYPWPGRAVDPSYAVEKWTSCAATRRTREWTGAVVAVFLSLLADAIATREAHTATS